MSRALILAGTDQFVARVGDLAGTQVVSLSRDAIVSEHFDLGRSLGSATLPDVIFIGAAVPSEIAVRIAKRTEEIAPSVDVVLMDDVPPDIVVEAIRFGFRDVLPPDAPDDHLRDVLRRAEARRAAIAPLAVTDVVVPITSGQESRTISVISPKGGVGKTSIATNLAIGMAAANPQDVVLVDLDLQFGDVAATLDLIPSHTIEEALSPAAAGDDLVVKTMLAVHPAGFYVMCGADSPAANDEVTGPQIVRLLRQLSTQFPYVIVDTAGGLTEPTLAALEVTDDVVIVSTMDVACVRGVRKAIEMLNRIGLMPRNKVLVLNLASNQSGLKVKDVEAAVDLPVDVVIARSHEVQLAANHGVPLMLAKKRGGSFAKSIRSLIRHLEKTGAPTSRKHKRAEVA